MKTAEEKEIYELIEVRKKAIHHLNVDRWLPEDTVWVAKQFAEQRCEKKIREKLIEYDKWVHEGNCTHLSGSSYKEFVDEFLKQTNKE
jgi:hypothetical protein